MLDSTPSASPCAEDPDLILRRQFGIDGFRPGQREAIEAVCAGQDALAVLPTGAGKSLIYQTAALMLPGTTLVVSPLIALMRDQVESLREHNYPGVAALHSDISESEQRAVCAALSAGELKLLYLTPERLSAPSFLECLGHTEVSLIAVDEAHAISQWGHDFRPEYQFIDDAARTVGRPPLLALTATATPWVRDDIIERLGLRKPRVVVRGFDRPNLFFEVHRATDEREKMALLLGLLARERANGSAARVEPYKCANSAELEATLSGSGLVYTSLTRTARELSQTLNRHGVHSAYYHGQLKPRQREAIHDRFREGSIQTIAATNAFGLGIDRGDIRYVLHYDTPSSLEAYFQEAGRAGRDGELARCTLIYLEDDLTRSAFSGATGALQRDELERVATVLSAAPKAGVTRAALAEAVDLSPSRILRALELLLRVGAAGTRRGRYVGRPVDPVALDRAAEYEERRQAHDRTRQDMMRAYVQTTGCRRQFILQYFGQYDAPDRCDMCDRCLSRAEEPATEVRGEEANADTLGLRPGDTVHHQTWGDGVVQSLTESRVTVRFEDAGYRTLDRAAVEERALLQPA